MYRRTPTVHQNGRGPACPHAAASSGERAEGGAAPALVHGPERLSSDAVSRRRAHSIPALSHTRLRAVAASSGAHGLGLEVLWTRLFAQVLHNSVYSFTAVALVFLFAFASGAAAAALLLRRVAPAVVAAAASLAAGIGTVAGVWTFVYSSDGLAYMGMHSGVFEYLWRIVGLAAASAGPAAFASGMLSPALWAAWEGHVTASRPLGELSAANMFGGIAGALSV